MAMRRSLRSCALGAMGALTLALVGTSLALGGQAPGPGAPNVDKAAVIRHLREREARTRSIKAYLTDLYMMNPDTLGPQSGLRLEGTIKGRYVTLDKYRWVSRWGRAYQDGTHIVFTGKERKVTRTQHWFDGKALYTMQASGMPRDSAQRQTGPFPTHVCELLQQASGIKGVDRGSLSWLIQEGAVVRITPGVPVRGFRCYQVEVHRKWPGVDYQTTFWFSPDRSWAMVRRDEVLLPFDAQIRRRLFQRVHRVMVVEELRKLPGGLWIPTHIRYDAWRIPKEGDGPGPQWISTNIYRASGVQVNVNVQDAELVAQLPSGTLVQGERGTRTVVGDDTLALEEALMRGQFPPLPVEPPRSAPPR